MDLLSVLQCLNGQIKTYPKGASIFSVGQKITHIGVLLRGGIQIYRDDVMGNRSIVAYLNEGDLFAEAFAYSNTKTLPVAVFATSESVVLLIDYRRIVSTCPSSCQFHSRIIENMLAILADKNIFLNRKIEHLSQRTTRGKLLSYLTEQATLSGTNTFDIPFDRQGLADYLCVERSAMSSCLSKLQDEGILTYRKNHFHLTPEKKGNPVP